jgi:phosphoglycolate phosphatase
MSTFVPEFVTSLLNYELVIFDLDGTLVDSHTQIAITLNEKRLQWGFPPKTLGFYHNNIGLPISYLIQDLNLTELDSKEFIADFRNTLHDKIISNTSLFPGVLNFLEMLEVNSIKIAVATSKPTDLATLTIKHSELSRYDIFVQGTDSFMPKPDPEVILRCLAEFGDPSAIMFGDRKEDIWAARIAGIQSVGITLGGHSEAELFQAGALRVFSDWTVLNCEIESKGR